MDINIIQWWVWCFGMMFVVVHCLCLWNKWLSLIVVNILMWVCTYFSISGSSDMLELILS